MNESSAKPLAVVTGAAGGLGSAVCEVLLERGWQILALDHNTERLSVLAQKYTLPAFQTLEIDVASSQFASAVAQQLPKNVPVKALVCIAAKSIGDDILNLSDEDWTGSFAVNTTPAMVLARLLAPRMIDGGGGSIVNVGSPVGIVGARKPSYAASKAALTGLTLSLARNLGSHNIRANLVLPGPMITPLTADWSQEKREQIASGSFLKRLCKPEEAARLIAFLLSSESSYITGAIIDATAGSMFGH